MKTIHKYQMSPEDPRLEIELPGMATVIFVNSQAPRVVHFWVEVDPDAEMHKRVFVLHGTGHDIPEDHWYIGSVLDPPFVWHLYEEYDIHEIQTRLLNKLAPTSARPVWMTSAMLDDAT